VHMRCAVLTRLSALRGAALRCDSHTPSALRGRCPVRAHRAVPTQRAPCGSTTLHEACNHHHAASARISPNGFVLTTLPRTLLRPEWPNKRLRVKYAGARRSWLGTLAPRQMHLGMCYTVRVLWWRWLLVLLHQLTPFFAARPPPGRRRYACYPVARPTHTARSQHVHSHGWIDSRCLLAARRLCCTVRSTLLLVHLRCAHRSQRCCMLGGDSNDAHELAADACMLEEQMHIHSTAWFDLSCRHSATVDSADQHDPLGG
jgi:hypothetical protein